jgi:hypothetical protein
MPATLLEHHSRGVGELCDNTSTAASISPSLLAQKHHADMQRDKFGRILVPLVNPIPV